ncbi:MAG: hypothetical protein ABI905_15800 [Betaproteobacteria bacterium]
MKNFLNVHSRQANSFAATTFGVVVMLMLVGGYEVTHAFSHQEQAVTLMSHAEPVARMQAIVVTTRRL